MAQANYTLSDNPLVRSGDTTVCPKNPYALLRHQLGETRTPAQVQAQTRAIMTLAMLAARGVVKNELKRQGRRLADVEAKEITIAARALLD